MESENAPEPKRSRKLPGLALAALGVVYGDIGTSPLYALRECFNGTHQIPINEVSVLGILSVLFWVLIIVISIKYILFVMNADNHGEGGILALTALVCPPQRRDSSILLLATGVFGAALLYGDGVITPAISVLSAVEGVELATPFFSHMVVPITILILLGLFSVQKYGTGRIGRIFGPVILLWFLVIGSLGIHSIAQDPSILRALNPIWAWRFFGHHRVEGYFVLGALFLVMTGGEALYADMGHFGKIPIRWAWFTVVLPGLVLNYFGQGALLLHSPAAKINPFYLMCPEWLLMPMIVLATVSTVIASQALISGVFSLTRQAISLNLSPRLQITHTSKSEIGQIYLPSMNWVLFIGSAGLVWGFGSSSRLAAAYGISVSLTMVITTLLMYFCARRIWRWERWQALSLTAVFVTVDFAFFSANLVKIEQGGYVPLLIGFLIFFLMMTWRKGRMIVGDRSKELSIDPHDYLASLEQMSVAKVPGVAIFLINDPNATPPAFINNVKHNKVRHETVIFLTLLFHEMPVIEPSERLASFKLATGVHRVVANYGFMDSPNVMDLVKLMQARGLKIAADQITFFLGRETLIATPRPGMAIWRERIFAFMARNAQRATFFFHIPADQVIEMGIQVEL